MIREIAAKSSGAQIKIMSSKEDEKEEQDCVVTIAGSLKNKQDACSLIIEQIESFKTGPQSNTNKFNEREVQKNDDYNERNNSKYQDRNHEKDYHKSSDRYRESKDFSDNYLDKRQEYKRYERSKSRSKSRDRYINKSVTLSR